MRYLLIVLSLLLSATISSCTVYPTHPANVSVGIGINVPVYPRLVLIPGHPVYYDPYINLNYFFYDGLYWVYTSDNWYASSWYNGPWDVVDRYSVPTYILRVPVRYYRQPPAYFRSWNANSAPRWQERWGRDWEQRQSRQDEGDRRPAARPAPLPNYQREYSGERYPREVERQHSIRNENYRYEPREAVTRERFKQKSQQKDQQRNDDGRGQDRR